MDNISITSAKDLREGDILSFGGIHYSFIPRNGTSNPEDEGRMRFEAKGHKPCLFLPSEVEDLLRAGLVSRPVYVRIVLQQKRDTADAAWESSTKRRSTPGIGIDAKHSSNPLSDEIPAFLDARREWTPENTQISGQK